MSLCGLCAAIALKFINIFGGYSVYAVSSVMENEIWFVMGMCLNYMAGKKVKKKDMILLGNILGIAFLGGSIVISVM